MDHFSGSLEDSFFVNTRLLRHAQGLQHKLYGLVSSSFGEDPRSGALYVFSNQRQRRIKVLLFDGWGCRFKQKTERGTFSWPKSGQTDNPELKDDAGSLRDAHRQGAAYYGGRN